jgi:hypothetical protein
VYGALLSMVDQCKCLALARLGQSNEAGHDAPL